MHDPSSLEHLSDRAEFRRRPHRPGVELYRAHIVRHAFEPHTHDGFGLGAIESGVERFRYRGADHLAPPGALVCMNPDELHTGHAETEGGWRYRMVYVDRAAAEEVMGERDWWFADAVRMSPHEARRVTALLDALWQAREPLAYDDLLLSLLQTFRPHARIRPASTEPAGRFAPVVDYLREHLARRITTDELAAVAGLSPFHFLRSFRRSYDATPQQVLMALRLDAAKRQLAAGTAPADVAADTGLADQAHLTRAFARRYGVTPARYQRQR
jgi:AraC-like DNA-binding protein